MWENKPLTPLSRKKEKKNLKEENKTPKKIPAPFSFLFFLVYIGISYWINKKFWKHFEYFFLAKRIKNFSFEGKEEVHA